MSPCPGAAAPAVGTMPVNIALCDKRRDQVRIARQHMDRHGPLLDLTADDGRRLVVAEQDDERIAGQMLASQSPSTAKSYLRLFR